MISKLSVPFLFKIPRIIPNFLSDPPFLFFKELESLVSVANQCEDITIVINVAEDDTHRYKLLKNLIMVIN